MQKIRGPLKPYKLLNVDGVNTSLLRQLYLNRVARNIDQDYSANDGLRVETNSSFLGSRSFGKTLWNFCLPYS